MDWQTFIRRTRSRLMAGYRGWKTANPGEAYGNLYEWAVMETPDGTDEIQDEIKKTFGQVNSQLVIEATNHPTGDLVATTGWTTGSMVNDILRELGRD
jgi:hypothetical protein